MHFYNKKIITIWTSCLFASLCLLVLFCTHQDIPNPLLSRFEGDYRLNLNKSDLADTLLTNVKYTIQYSTGTDTFAYVQVTTPDTSYLLTHYSSDSSFNLEFKKSYSGWIVFSGIRPNEKRVKDSLMVHVISDPQLQLPVVSFTDTSYQIDRGDSSTFIAIDSSNVCVKFIWRFGTQSPETTSVGSIKKLFPLESIFKGYVAGIDKYGRVSNEDSTTIVVKPFDYQISSFLPDTIRARYTSLLKITVKDSSRFKSGSGKVYWHMSLGTDSSDTNGVDLFTISKNVHDSAFMIVSVWVQDSSLKRSQKITRVIVVREFRPTAKFLKNIDTTRADLPVTIRVKAADTDPDGGKVDSLYFDLNGDGKVDKIGTATSFTISPTNSGLINITVYAKDKDGFFSKPDTLHLLVISDRPFFNPLAKDTTLYINSKMLMKVNGNPGQSGVPVTAYFWKINGAENFRDTTTSDTLSYRFVKTGIDTVTVDCKDNDGLGSSTQDTFFVTVDPGKPRVIKITPDSVWINDTTSYKVIGTDPNGTIQRRAVSWDSEQPFEIKSDSTFSHSYSREGLKVVKMFVVDNDSISSDTLTDSVFVKLGKPTATPLFEDSVFYAKQVAYKLRGIDPNGTVKQWGVSWDTGLPFTVQTDSNFTHGYMTEGLKHTKAYVVDNDGISSDTVSKVVYVKLGRPQVTSITVDRPLNSIYIRDSLNFVFRGSDNDKIDSIMVSWDDDTIFEVRQKAVGDSLKYRNFQFARSDSGVKSIVVRVKDPDGLTKDSVLTVTVLSGAPIVDSIAPSNVWVVDQNVYSIYARDLNGSVDSFTVDWKNTGTWEGKKTKTFSHIFDTTMAGARTVKVKVMDNDSVWAVRSFSLNVKLGRPIVKSGATYGNSNIQWVVDTLFYIYTGGNPTFAIDTVDSNGTIQKFYWDIYGDGVNDSTNVPYWTQFVPAGTATKMVIVGRDDDQLKSVPYIYYMYPDPPPPEPTVGATKVGNDIKIEWFGQDAKDSCFTEFKIIYKKSTLPSPKPTIDENTDILHDFSEGISTYNYVSGTSGYSFTFTPTDGSGYYFFQIIARDKRGSKTISTDKPYVNY